MHARGDNSGTSSDISSTLDHRVPRGPDRGRIPLCPGLHRRYEVLVGLDCVEDPGFDV